MQEIETIRKALAISEKTAACKHDYDLIAGRKLIATVCSNALATLNQLEAQIPKWLPITKLPEDIDVLGYWEVEESNKGYACGYDVISKENGKIHGSECTYHNDLFVKFQYITPLEKE